MGKKTRILLTVCIGLFILPPLAEAQEEQWLQYHSEREAHRIMPEMGSVSQGASTEKPPGVNLPEFKTEKPLFVWWSTPMVDSNGLWIAVDRTSEAGKPDRLYIDSNGNGHLDDETVVKAYQTDDDYTFFGPVKVVFAGEDGPVTYHLNFRYFDYNAQNQRLTIYAGGWYEGEIVVGGQKQHCVLIDHNANGTFNDKSSQSPQSDRIQVGKKGTRDTVWVGNYLEIDEVFYTTEIAQDGAFIKLTKAEDLRFGTLRVPETITTLTIGGENGMFVIEPEQGAGKLLVGEYCVDNWQIDRKDKKGKNWTLQGRFYNNQGRFGITEGTETSLEIGEPVTTALSARLNGENYEFSKSLRGAQGEYLTLSSGGRDVSDLWKMKGTNKEGTFERIYPIPDQ